MGFPITHDVDMCDVIKSITHTTVDINAVARIDDETVVVNYHGKPVAAGFDGTENDMIAVKIVDSRLKRVKPEPGVMESYLVAVKITDTRVTVGVPYKLAHTTYDVLRPKMVSNGDGSVTVVHFYPAEKVGTSRVSVSHVNVLDSLHCRLNTRQFEYTGTIMDASIVSLSEKRIALAISVRDAANELIVHTVDVDKKVIKWNPFTHLFDGPVYGYLDMVALNDSSVVVGFSVQNTEEEDTVPHSTMLLAYVKFDYSQSDIYQISKSHIPCASTDLQLCRLDDNQIAAIYIDDTLSSCAVFTIYDLTNTGQLNQFTARVFVRTDAYSVKAIHPLDRIGILDVDLFERHFVYRYNLDDYYDKPVDLDCPVIEHPKRFDSSQFTLLSDRYLLTVGTNNCDVDTEVPHTWDFILTEYQ